MAAARNHGGPSNANHWLTCHLTDDEWEANAMHDGAPAGRQVSAAFFNPANIVTFGRLCLVPLAFLSVLDHRTGQAFGLFVVAGLSDALDGWLARRHGGNALGAVLDPIADKALLVTMYITLAAVGALPGWVAILVVFRDILIVGGIVMFAVLGHTLAIRPLFISKVNTALQIVLVAACLLHSGFGLGVGGFTTLLIWCVALTTLASGAAYVWSAVRGD